MRTSDPDIYAVGDAAEYAFGVTGVRMRLPLAGPANRTGRLAGEHAATGASRPAPAAWGTSVMRCFGCSAGLTGLSLRSALAAGFEARAVHVVANHHASYYPGAQTLVLKLVYEAGSGRVLGVQAVGGAGVDKRLDVAATLLHFRGTVHDLAELDLAYAPPFGAAKDPLHMAAFTAQNDLDGLARILAPDADLSAYQVVDVRERARGAGAAHRRARRTPSTSPSTRCATGSPSWTPSCRPWWPAAPACAPTWAPASWLSTASGRSTTSLARWPCATSRSYRRLPATLATATGLPAPDAIMID